MVQRATVLLFQTHVITPSQSFHRVDDQIRSTMQVMQYRAPRRSGLGGWGRRLLRLGRESVQIFQWGGGLYPPHPRRLVTHITADYGFGSFWRKRALRGNARDLHVTARCLATGAATNGRPAAPPRRSISQSPASAAADPLTWLSARH